MQSPAPSWAPADTSPADYEATLDAATVARVFSAVRTAPWSGWVESGAPVGIDWLDATAKDQLLASREVVRRFVACEFDTATPGERGIGRLGDQWPRLGGVFRKKLADPAVQQQLGPRIEELVCFGFAVAVIFDVAVGSGQRPEPRERSTEELWQLWIPNASTGMLSDRGMVGVAAEDAMLGFDHLAKQLGVRKRVGRQKDSVLMTSGFYALSGAALYEAQVESVEQRT